MSEANDMTALTSRAERLVSTLTDAILATAEVAAERIQLAAELARFTQRMSAFRTALEMVAAQKTPLLAELAAATGSLHAFLTKQLEMLTAQEAAVLVKIGYPAEAARQAIACVDAEPVGTHRRQGKRFVPLTNGNGV